MDRSSIAIVLPALNEAATISAVVHAISAYGSAIVVDDGSSDNTAALARAAGAHVISHAHNRGYDAALNSGFAWSAERGYTHVISIDADGQHQPEQLGEMIAYLAAGYDLVLGVRGRYQRFSELVFAACSKRLWGVADPLCGMKAYSMALYLRVGHFDGFESIGTELALRSVVHGCRFKEMPIHTRERLDAPRFGHSLNANYKILRALSILLWLYLSRKLGR